MKRLISLLFSFIAVLALITAGYHTSSAKDNVKNKSGSEISIVKNGIDFVAILNEPIFIPVDWGVVPIHSNAKTVKQFDLVTHPRISKHLRYSMANS